MNDLAKARSAKLGALSNCPCCGSERLGSSGAQGRIKVFFVCGATFAADIGRIIEPTVPCPSPSMVAAERLNEEVSAEIRRAAS